jgi:hypothetical protein
MARPRGLGTGRRASRPLVLGTCPDDAQRWSALIRYIAYCEAPYNALWISHTRSLSLLSLVSPFIII